MVLDLDGTLLNGDKQVSERNSAAVLSCYRKGMKVIIATARPPRSVKSMLPEELLAVCSFVYYNGALLVDPALDLEEHHPIEMSTTEEVLTFCSDNLPEACVSIEVNDTWYSNREQGDAMFNHPLFKPIVCSWEELRKVAATKILISQFADPEQLRALFQDKLQFVLTDGGQLIQLMNKSVTKAVGVLSLLRHYGVEATDAIVFGDDYNDLELFRMSAYAVAMGNAVDELKALANEITDSNDRDGVAQVLEGI
ncbi:HAD family hydrolase [Paenibacillus sp. HB172176]|uniref:HAD family hydrolase n=1 Tax=Paenibacillus sp. HB172176 TaxID=2493690 RepID=UPI001F0E3614|nr:HAD family hydrolase [Paenibacillus sp. HB172176]